MISEKFCTWSENLSQFRVPRFFTVFGENGDMKNSSFLDYRMPTCYDTPMIDTVLVEVPNPGHPFGVRGVGEVPLVPPLAAIANAVSRAIGVRMTDLPMNPGVVLKALDKI